MPKLTKTFIENIAPIESGQTFYRDSELRGFALRVTKRGKTFVVEKRVDGRNRRVSIDDYDTIPIAEARRRATVLLAEMANGEWEPIKTNNGQNSITLRDAYDKYISVRPLAKNTRASYKFCIETCLADWLDIPFSKITKDMVEERHKLLSTSTTRIKSRGEARANATMKTLKSILNFASERFAPDDEPILKRNPVDRLTANKQWHRKVVREGLVVPSKLAPWYRVVHAIPNKIARDYLLFLLFTGMRRSEVAQLRWSDLDFGSRIVNVPREITKMKRAYSAPLCEFLVQLLSARKSNEQTDLIFPSLRYKERPISNVSHHLPELRKACGYEFRIHDLRRTFLTTGATLGVPFHILKNLVNHKLDKDITDRYVVADMETKRSCAEEISKEMIQLTGARVCDLIEGTNDADNTSQNLKIEFGK